MKVAKVTKIDHKNWKTLVVEIDIEDSVFVQQPKEFGFPTLVNCGTLQDGLDIFMQNILEGSAALHGVRNERSEILETLNKVDSLLCNLANEGRNYLKLRSSVLKQIEALTID